MKQNMQDLTEGPLGKKILIFSVPLMLSNLLQVLFNMADIAVIGQFAGSLSLGAVGSTATLVTMFTGFLIGLSGGINVLTALYYGAKDRENRRRMPAFVRLCGRLMRRSNHMSKK